MTQNEFLVMCGECLIDPNIALENAEIVEALKKGDSKLVEKLLKEQF